MVQEKLSNPERIVIHNIAVRVGAYVHVVEKSLAFIDHGIAVGKVALPFPEGLDLGSDEGDTAYGLDFYNCTISFIIMDLY